MNTEFKAEYESLGRNIAYYRKRNNMTQVQLAHMLGVDKSHLNSVELGSHAPSMDFVFKVCEILGVTEKELFVFTTYKEDIR